MMCKKEILELLKDMKQQACVEATKEIEVEIKAEEARICEKLCVSEVAKTIESKVGDILELMTEFKAQAENIGCHRKDGYCGSVAYSLSLISTDMERKILNNEIYLDSRKLTELREKASAVRGVISSEWNKVINNCAGLSKNKDVVKYLVSLGFDAKQFEYDACGTSIMVPVNVALLCRKETGNEMD